MKLRRMLLQTTMLSGIIGGVFLSGLSVRAADLQARPPLVGAPPTLPAVDGINAKIEGFGGSLGNDSVYGSRGALSVPLGGQFGTQIDGMIGSWAGRTFENIAPHVFWRNPAQGLLGFYTSHTWWDRFGGVYVGQVAGEGESYLGQWTLQGIAGAEYGNSRTNAIVTPAGTLLQSFDIKTRFFDEINVKYYVNSNWEVFVGHRYLGGRNALALGTQFVLPIGIGRGAIAAAFVEGRVGASNAQGVWGGVKLYFGQKDKSLIDRHRQDDPEHWSIGTLFSVNNALSQAFVPKPRPTVISVCTGSAC
jgi:hypothetical protein